MNTESYDFSPAESKSEELQKARSAGSKRKFGEERRDNSFPYAPFVALSEAFANNFLGLLDFPMTFAFQDSSITTKTAVLTQSKLQNAPEFQYNWNYVGVPGSNTGPLPLPIPGQIYLPVSNAQQQANFWNNGLNGYTGGSYPPSNLNLCGQMFGGQFFSNMRFNSGVSASNDRQSGPYYSSGAANWNAYNPWAPGGQGGCGPGFSRGPNGCVPNGNMPLNMLSASAGVFCGG